MMSDIAAKLDEARALIEKGWCQNTSFTNDAGEYCPHREATKFCTWGALTYRGASGCGQTALDYISDVVGENAITWQDRPERTQAEVIEAFRKAAELARQEQSA